MFYTPNKIAKLTLRISPKKLLTPPLYYSHINTNSIELNLKGVIL